MSHSITRILSTLSPDKLAFFRYVHAVAQRANAVLPESSDADAIFEEMKALMALAIASGMTAAVWRALEAEFEQR